MESPGFSNYCILITTSQLLSVVTVELIPSPVGSRPGRASGRQHSSCAATQAVAFSHCWPLDVKIPSRIEHTDKPCAVPLAYVHSIDAMQIFQAICLARIVGQEFLCAYLYLRIHGLSVAPSERTKDTPPHTHLLAVSVPCPSFISLCVSSSSVPPPPHSLPVCVFLTALFCKEIRKVGPHPAHEEMHEVGHH